MTKDEFKEKYGITPHKDILRGDLIATAALKECGKHKPVADRYGVAYCQKCEDDAKKVKKISAFPEMVPEYIKKDREKNAASMVQSHRQGELSKEFVTLYPQRVKGMLKEGVITHDEVRKAKPVWKNDIPNYNNLHKTL